MEPSHLESSLVNWMWWSIELRCCRKLSQVGWQEDGSLKTTVYRKPTHTDLYLQWDSNHTITSKYSVVDTLHHRAQVICSSPELLQQEEKHLHQALTRCNYPEWALNRAKIRCKTRKTKKLNNNTKDSASSQNQRPYIVVPYYKGVSESLKKICGKHGVQVYFNGGHTIKSLLVAPKGSRSNPQKEWGHL